MSLIITARLNKINFHLLSNITTLLDKGIQIHLLFFANTVCVLSRNLCPPRDLRPKQIDTNWGLSKKKMKHDLNVMHFQLIIW